VPLTANQTDRPGRREYARLTAAAVGAAGDARGSFEILSSSCLGTSESCARGAGVDIRNIVDTLPLSTVKWGLAFVNPMLARALDVLTGCLISSKGNGNEA
jgi:hypothetical protein